MSVASPEHCARNSRTPAPLWANCGISKPRWATDLRERPR
jgi:hypothetical protein